MFATIFTHRLRCLLRDRGSLFWSFAFPVILGTFFAVALTSTDNIDLFTRIPIAVVDNTAYQQDNTLRQALKTVSKKQDDGTQALFKVQKLTRAQADKALKAGDITGYLIDGEGENGLRVVVDDTGTDQTILKLFADQYLQTKAAYADIARQDPAALQQAVTVETLSFVRSAPVSRHMPKESATYFYALIAMACLYGAFWGLKEICALQANQSPQGARVSMAPVHKLHVFGASLCAALLLQTASTALLIAYLQFVLNIQFAAQLGYVLLTCAAGSLAGVMLGAMLAVLITGVSEAGRSGIISMVSVGLSFFAGLMYDKMKFIIASNAPVLAWLNPASLISDSLYALYYFDSHTRYFADTAMLLVLSAAMFAVVYFALRRQKYESL